MSRSKRPRDVAISGLLTAALAIACTPGVHETEKPDLQELVARWAFNAAETDLDPPAVYCLAMSPLILEEGDDPEEAFLDRFSDLTVPVRPVSACRFEGGTRHNVMDDASGEYRLLFTIGPVVMEGSDRATVEVGYLQGALWEGDGVASSNKPRENGGVQDCQRVIDI